MEKVSHILKSWVGLFEPILKGEKTHDIRVMDRDYKVGDICRLREYEPTTRVIYWARGPGQDHLYYLI